MERSARYTHFSGLSGVLSGILALVGCGVTYWASYHVPIDSQLAWFVTTWSLVLVTAITEDLLLAHRNAKAAGGSIWSPATYQIMRAVLPSLFVALVISIGAGTVGALETIPAIWALGYGAAMCSAGMFAVREVGIYGVVQLITGAVGLLGFWKWPFCLYQLALSFGVYQILFGLWLTWKYRK